MVKSTHVIRNKRQAERAALKAADIGAAALHASANSSTSPGGSAQIITHDVTSPPPSSARKQYSMPPLKRAKQARMKQEALLKKQADEIKSAQNHARSKLHGAPVLLSPPVNPIICHDGPNKSAASKKTPIPSRRKTRNNSVKPTRDRKSPVVYEAAPTVSHTRPGFNAHHRSQEEHAKMKRSIKSLRDERDAMQRHLCLQEQVI